MRIIFRCDPAIEAILPKPYPARRGLPDWLKAMPMTAFSDFHGRDVRTVKQCPPFVDAMSTGFIIPLPCDIEVDQGRFAWDWPLPPLTLKDHPRSPLSFHVNAQVTGSPLFDAGSAILKFNSFWTIKLEPGYALLAMHPANRMDLPFRLLTGLVDADRFKDVGIFFPAVWTDRGFSGLLPKGTPVAQCIPLRHEPQELVHETLSGAAAAAFAATTEAVLAAPGVYKARFRRRDRR